MADVYIRSCPEQGTVGLRIDLESLIILHVIKICNNKKITLHVLQCESDVNEPIFKVEPSDVCCKFVSHETVPELATHCKWPVIVVGNTVVAGLASVSRQIIKSSADEQMLALLGFREACLMACNETSIWTKFCEIDMVSTVKKLLKRPESFISDAIHIPEDLSRFESHMGEPVRVHNVYKLARIKNNDKLIKSSVPVEQLNLDHTYGEGPYMTLADLLLYPCFKIIFHVFNMKNLEDHLPLSVLWYENLSKDLEETKFIFELPINFCLPPTDLEVFQEIVTKQSLYTADPKRYKPQSRIYTRQSDVEKALNIAATLSMGTHNKVPFGYDTNFSWAEIPLEANPLGGALPESRANRKCQQLENLVKPVIKIAENGCYRIVDFCSGSGHLGILIATLLPNSHVILVENKERSLQRAHERIKKMQLVNVSLVQSNLDYFVANFDIGMALHACGVATDLVIKTCINNRAHFVCCPCCYGGIHNCHHLTYPRSKMFKETLLKYRDYLIIGHSADQTHDKDNVKTAQGYMCMDVIDTDRKLQAEECGYQVHLSKLSPPSCTPKNNLLVGLVNFVT